MSRNLKKDYLNKLAAVKTNNGFAVDLANYLCNPSYDYDYPTLAKTIEHEDGTRERITVRYYKHYDGTGEYEKETHIIPTTNDNVWYIAKNTKTVELEKSNRFNLKKLIQLAEAI